MPTAVGTGLGGAVGALIGLTLGGVVLPTAPGSTARARGAEQRPSHGAASAAAADGAATGSQEW